MWKVNNRLTVVGTTFNHVNQLNVTQNDNVSVFVKIYIIYLVVNLACIIYLISL